MIARIFARLSRAARASIGPVAVFLVLQEIVGRWAFPFPEVYGFHRLRYAGSLDDHLHRANAANIGHMATWWWSEPDGAAYPLVFNLYGFRDREWSRAKPDGARRVAFVGDSFVEGLGAPQDEQLTQVFARRAEAAGEKLDVLNWGAGGFGLENYAQLIADGVPGFRPDDLILVVYANDLYSIPQRDPFVRTAPPPEHYFRPRLLEVYLARRWQIRIPPRWRADPPPEPTPIDVAPRFAADPQMVRNIDLYVDPPIAESMRAGHMNPAMTNLLERSVRVLPKSVQLEPYLAALRVHLEPHLTRVAVAFLPSLNQVSDAYLDAQRRISAPIDVASLTGDAYQQHARDLARDCAALGIPFLDLTPALRAAEASGERLYWPYDGHMRPAGYERVGRELYAWWQRELAGR